MKNLFWIGSRESDVANEEMFIGSITRYGEENNRNTSFCNNSYTNDYYIYIRNTTEDFVRKFDAKFIFANEQNAYKCSKLVFDNTLCINNLATVQSLNNKIFIRNYLKDIVSVPECIIINSQSAKDDHFIKAVFNKKYNDFVIQDPNGAGGLETDFLSRYNFDDNINNYLLITPYIQNGIPINVHTVVSDYEYRVFPPSIQIIHNTFCYVGSDFIKAQRLDDIIKKKILKISKNIAKKIMQLNVRGFFGIDLLITKEKLFFLECNFRYQGSSFLINKALCNMGLPSYYRIQYDAFYNNIKKIPIDIFNMPINYSSFRRTVDNIQKQMPEPIEIKIDGDINDDLLRNGYKYYEVYNQSIIDLFQK